MEVGEEASGTKDGVDGSFQRRSTRSSYGSTLCGGVLLVFLAISAGLSLLLDLVGIHVGFATAPALLLSSLMLVFLRPQLLASVVCNIIHIGVRLMSNLNVSVSVGSIDLFGMKINDIALTLNSGKSTVSSSNTGKGSSTGPQNVDQVLFVRQLALDFAFDRRHPLHASSAPLLALHIRGTKLTVTPQTSLLLNPQLSKGTKSKGDGKKKNSMVQRLMWIFRLVLVDMDHIKITVLHAGTSVDLVCSKVAVSCSSVESKEKHKMKMLRPKLTVDSFQAQLIDSRKFPLLNINDIAASFDILQVPTNREHICSCLQKVKSNENKQVKIDECDLNVGSIMLFSSVEVLKLLTNFNENTVQKSDLEDEASSVTGSVISSVFNRVNNALMGTKLVAKTNSVASGEFVSVSRGSVKSEEPPAIEVKDSSSEDSDVDTWECLNCSFYNGLADVKCQVCGHLENEPVAAEVGVDTDMEAADDNGNSSIQKRRVGETMLCELLEQAPSVLNFGIAKVFVTIEGENIRKKQNVFPGSLTVETSFEVTLECKSVMSLECAVSLKQLKVAVDCVRTDVLISRHLSSTILSENIVLDHELISWKGELTCEVDEQCFTSDHFEQAKSEAKQICLKVWPPESPQRAESADLQVLPSEIEWECNACSFVNERTNTKCSLCNIEFSDHLKNVNQGFRENLKSENHHHLTKVKFSLSLSKLSLFFEPRFVDYALAFMAIFSPSNYTSTPTLRKKKSSEGTASKTIWARLWARESTSVSYLRQIVALVDVDSIFLSLKENKSKQSATFKMEKVTFKNELHHLIPISKAAKSSTQHIVSCLSLSHETLGFEQTVSDGCTYELLTMPDKGRYSMTVAKQNSSFNVDLLICSVAVSKVKLGLATGQLYHLASLFLDYRDCVRALQFPTKKRRPKKVKKPAKIANMVLNIGVHEIELNLHPSTVAFTRLSMVGQYKGSSSKSQVTTRKVNWGNFLKLEQLSVQSNAGSFATEIESVLFELDTKTDFGEITEALLLQRKALRLALKAMFKERHLTLFSASKSLPSKSKQATVMHSIAIHSGNVKLLEKARIVPLLHVKIQSLLGDFSLETKRSVVLNKLWNLDDCVPLAQCALAHTHGFSSVDCFVFKALSCDRLSVQLRNHRQPLVLVKKLELCKTLTLIIAELNPSETCSRLATVQLQSGVDNLPSVPIEVTRGGSPAKFYFSVHPRVQSLEVNYGNCLSETFNALDPVLARLVAKAATSSTQQQDIQRTLDTGEIGQWDSSDELLKAEESKSDPDEARTKNRLQLWDKLMYLCHGNISIEAKNLHFCLLTEKPTIVSGIQIRATDVTLSKMEVAKKPELKDCIDMWGSPLEQESAKGADKSRNTSYWTLDGEDIVISALKQDNKRVEQYDVIHSPKLHSCVGLEWIKPGGLGHYVQLHPVTRDDLYRYLKTEQFKLSLSFHCGGKEASTNSSEQSKNSTEEQEPSKVRFEGGKVIFRGRRLSINASEQAVEATNLYNQGVITLEEYEQLLRADKSFRENQSEEEVGEGSMQQVEGKPWVAVCWKVWPILCKMYRIIFKSSSTGPKKETFGSLLNGVDVEVCVDRINILWWEKQSSKLGLLLCGKSLVYKSSGNSLLLQCLETQAFFIDRVQQRPNSAETKHCPETIDKNTIDGSGVNWDCWSCFPYPTMNDSFFLYYSALLLATGDFDKLLPSDTPRRDTTTQQSGLKLVIDECRLLYTLEMRDKIFCCASSIVTGILLEQSKSAELNQKSETKMAGKRRSSQLLVGKKTLKRLNSNIVKEHLHDSYPVDFNVLYAPIQAPSEEMKKLLKRVVVDSDVMQFDADADAGEVFENGGAEVIPYNVDSDIGQYNTDSDYNDASVEYTTIEGDVQQNITISIELRWAQVKLVSGKDSAILCADSTLIGVSNTEQDLTTYFTTREVSAKVSNAKVYISEELESEWVPCKPNTTEYCVVETLLDYDFSLPLMPDSPNRNNTRIPTSIKSQPVLADMSFSVTDTSHNIIQHNITQATTEKIPPNVIDVIVPWFDINLKSEEFFTVLGIIRNLLLVPPSQDLKPEKPEAEDLKVTEQNRLHRRSSSAANLHLELTKEERRSRARTFDNFNSTSKTLSSHSSDNSIPQNENPIQSITQQYEQMITDSKSSGISADLKSSPEENTELQSLQSCFISEKLISEASQNVLNNNNDLRVLSGEVKRIYITHSEPFDDRERVISYSVMGGRLTLLGEKGEGEVMLTLTGLKGVHRFDVLDCTRVHVALQKLHLEQCKGEEIFNGRLSKTTSSSRESPLLRVEAHTAPPLFLGGYKVNLYRRLQVHVFPGAEYSLTLRLNRQLAEFLSVYFVDDDDDDEDEIAVDIKGIYPDQEFGKKRKPVKKKKQKKEITHSTELKERVFFHYVRTSRLDVQVILDRVPIVPKSGLNLVANGIYNLSVNGILLHSELMRWTRLYKHIRNQAIKGVVKSLITPLKRRADSPSPSQKIKNKKDAILKSGIRRGNRFITNKNTTRENNGDAVSEDEDKTERLFGRVNL